MIALILYLCGGVGLFVLLFVLARRNHAPAAGSAHIFVEARGSLQTLQQGLLPRDLIQRIFDRQDLRYVTEKMPTEIQRLFLAERKRISLQWVRRVRLELLNLMHFHRGHSRFHSQIRMSTELRLALDFAGLLLACRILEALFYFRGPYAAPGMVNATAAGAARLCTASEKSLSFLDGANLRPFDGGSTRGNATI
jgi:hypothetical protein